MCITAESSVPLTLLVCFSFSPRITLLATMRILCPTAEFFFRSRLAWPIQDNRTAAVSKGGFPDSLVVDYCPRGHSIPVQHTHTHIQSNSMMKTSQVDLGSCLNRTILSWSTNLDSTVTNNIKSVGKQIKAWLSVLDLDLDLGVCPDTEPTAPCLHTV